MSDEYTTDDHKRLATLVSNVIHDINLEDAEFCLFAVNIMLNAVMRCEQPMRARMLAQMMGTVRKSI